MIKTLACKICRVAASLDDGKQKKLAVLLGGTANDEGSRTSIAKLHTLTTLQNNPNTRTSYIKGVGTDGKLLYSSRIPIVITNKYRSR